MFEFVLCVTVLLRHFRCARGTSSSLEEDPLPFTYAICGALDENKSEHFAEQRGSTIDDEKSGLFLDKSRADRVIERWRDRLSLTGGRRSHARHRAVVVGRDGANEMRSLAALSVARSLSPCGARCLQDFYASLEVFNDGNAMRR
jgi:hypothetical protein